MLPAGTYPDHGRIAGRAAAARLAAAARIFNSLLVFGEGGSLTAPLRQDPSGAVRRIPAAPAALEAIGLQQLTRLRGGFDAGVVPRPLLSVPGLPPAGPLICYEAIFPRAIVQGAERPGLLINVTNDGWFGNTTGPRQHLHQARVRAVEEGLPLIRAANNGISAGVDGYGRVLARLDLNVRGLDRCATAGCIVAPALCPDRAIGVSWRLWALGVAILRARTR